MKIFNHLTADGVDLTDTIWNKLNFDVRYCLSNSVFWRIRDDETFVNNNIPAFITHELLDE